MSARATQGPRQHMVHRRSVGAPREVLYDLASDVTRWPVLFGPTLHVDVIERDAGGERFHLWAMVGDEARTWTSRRSLDPDRFEITFEQERTEPPIAAMGGRWRFLPRPGNRTEVVLEHEFAAADGDRETVERLNAAVDRNSDDELAALGRLAELGHVPDDLVDSFEDVVELPVPAADAFSFILRSDLWPDRIPHVGRVVLREPQPGVQDMEMDTITSDGSHHTTRSIRVCYPEERIVYKQLVPPVLLLGHSGAWSFAAGPGAGVAVTARHMVAIDPTKVESVLGARRTLADARAYLRDALGTNSRATLAHAGRAGS